MAGLGVVSVLIAALAGAVIGVNLTFLYCRRSLAQMEQRYRDLQSTLANYRGGGLMSKEQWERRRKELIPGLWQPDQPPSNTNRHSPSPPPIDARKKTG